LGGDSACGRNGGGPVTLVAGVGLPAVGVVAPELVEPLAFQAVVAVPLLIGHIDVGKAGAEVTGGAGVVPTPRLLDLEATTVICAIGDHPSSVGLRRRRLRLAQPQ